MQRIVPAGKRLRAMDTHQTRAMTSNTRWIRAIRALNFHFHFRCQPRLANRTRSLYWILTWAIIASCLPASAQIQDRFEGGEPRWTLVESDCAATLAEHEISLITPHSGRTSELMAVTCGQGTQVLLAYPIEPSAILNEFEPSIWTRCSSSRIRIGIRIVFPFASHPVTGRHLTAIVWGTSYDQPGAWQQLSVRRLATLVEQEKIALRSRFGADLRLEGAFVDSLVLNAYTGPGRYRMQVDDLRLTGIVSMAAIGNPPPPNWRELWQWRQQARRPKNEFWKRPNTPPVWLQYRNESLPWIESLGIAGIVTDQLPTQETLASAHRSNLGVISPPATFPVEFDSDSFASLRGWLIGSGLDSRQLENAKHQVSRVAAYPAELQRPLIAEALEGHFQYSRIADELIIPMPLASSPSSAIAKSEWLSEKLQTTRQRSLGWVSVNLSVPPSLADQLETASQIVAPDQDLAPLRVSPMIFRHQLLQAYMAGAQGVLVRTFEPLDLKDAADSAQIAALRWTQHDLGVWGPWIMAGERGAPAALSSSDWTSATWQLEKSQLIIAQIGLEARQFCTPPTGNDTLDIGLTTNDSAAMVFRLTQNRLERVTPERTPLGLLWTIEEPAPTEAFVVTSDPKIIDFLQTQTRTGAASLAADLIELAAHQLGHATQLAAARTAYLGTNDIPELTRRIQECQREVNAATSSLRTNQPQAAIQLAFRAQNSIQSVLYEGLLQARESLSSFQSSPLILTPAGLHLHWLVADACRRSQWESRPIPAANFRDLTEMEQNGWSQQRRLEDQVSLRVELIPKPSTETNNETNEPSKEARTPTGLRLAAYSKRPSKTIAGGFEGASLRVKSAATPIKAGQFVRVSGTAHLLADSPHASAGLLLYDNQVGQSFGQLLHGSAGDSLQIELYRFAVVDGDFRVFAECRGECDVVLESLRMDVINPAANRHTFSTGPFQEMLFESTQMPSILETQAPSATRTP